MKKSSEILCKAVVSSLVGALLACGPAQAQPRPYTKTLTSTQSSTTPAPPSPRTFHAPAATKYSTVKLTRARREVAMETLQVAHEGLTGAPRNRPRPEGITIPLERFDRR